MNTATFFSYLYTPYDRLDLRIEVRSRPSSGEHWYSSHFQLDQDGCNSAADYCKRSAASNDVYMGVLPRIKAGRSALDVPQCAWLWVEIDGSEEGADGADRLLGSALFGERIMQPQIVVNSGGGLHIYFKLQKPVPLHSDKERNDLALTLKRMCSALGNVVWDRWTLKPRDAARPFPDAKSTDCARILRVPGTHNHKPNRDKDVQIIQVNPEAPVLSYAQWQAFLPEVPDYAVPRQFIMPMDSGDLAPRIQRDILTHFSDGERHSALRRILYHARKRGKEFNDLMDIAERFKSNHPGWRDNVMPLVRDTVRRVTVSL